MTGIMIEQFNVFKDMRLKHVGAKITPSLNKPQAHEI